MDILAAFRSKGGTQQTRLLHTTTMLATMESRYPKTTSSTPGLTRMPWMLPLHKLLPCNTWRQIEYFELFTSCPRDELHQWYHDAVCTWYILSIPLTYVCHITYLGTWAYSLITLCRLSSTYTRNFCDALICCTRKESLSSPRLASRLCAEGQTSSALTHCS